MTNHVTLLSCALLSTVIAAAMTSCSAKPGVTGSSLAATPSAEPADTSLIGIKTGRFSVYPGNTIQEMPVGQDANCTSGNLGSLKLTMTGRGAIGSVTYSGWPLVNLCSLSMFNHTPATGISMPLDDELLANPPISHAVTGGVVMNGDGSSVALEFLYSLYTFGNGQQQYACNTQQGGGARWAYAGSMDCNEFTNLSGVSTSADPTGVTLTVEGTVVKLPWQILKKRSDYPGQ